MQAKSVGCPSKPTWHHLPNLEKKKVIWHLINALRPPPTPPWAPKHPRWVYHTLLPPKYKISRPKSCGFPPNVPNSECNHLTITSSIVYLYLLVSPTPPNSAPYPALPSGTLGR